MTNTLVRGWRRESRRRWLGLWVRDLAGFLLVAAVLVMVTDLVLRMVLR